MNTNDLYNPNININYCRSLRIDVLDDSCNLFLICLKKFVNKKWHFVDCAEIKPFHFYQFNFTYRCKWNIRVFKFDKKLIKIFESTYNEKDKNVCIYFKNDNYEAHKDWLMQSLKLSIENKFNLFIISKYFDRLKNDFMNFNNCIYDEPINIDDFEKNHNIYSSYIINRHEILTKKENHGNNEMIFVNNCNPCISWNHRKNWLGMNHTEIFNDIISYE